MKRITMLRIGLAASIAVWVVIILASMLSAGPARIAGGVLCPQGWRMERETSQSREGTGTHFICTSPTGEEQDRSFPMLLLQGAFGLPTVIFATLLVIQADKDAVAQHAAPKKDQRRGSKR